MVPSRVSVIIVEDSRSFGTTAKLRFSGCHGTEKFLRDMEKR